MGERAQTTQDTGPRRCHRCHNIGHLARDCFDRRGDTSGHGAGEVQEAETNKVQTSPCANQLVEEGRTSPSNHDKLITSLLLSDSQEDVGTHQVCISDGGSKQYMPVSS